jgi:predicted neuraminidase
VTPGFSDFRIFYMGSYGNDVLVPENESVLTPTESPFRHSMSFIPSVTVQCHASNLLLLENNDVLCAWFGGSQEGRRDISIYTSRLSSASRQWSDARQVTYDGTRSEQNPVLFRTPAGEIWLLYTSQNAGDQDSAVVKQQASQDEGQTWSSPDVLFSDPGTFIRQPMIVLDGGEWLIPIFKCRTEPGTRWIGNDDVSAVRVSYDQGKTWAEREVPNSFGAVHMEVQRLTSGGYIGLFRSRWADNIYIATSSNALDWTEPRPTVLPNPNAGFCFNVLPSGRVLVVYNHSSKAKAVGQRESLYDDVKEEGDERHNQQSKHAGRQAFWGAPRAPLCLAWSDDDGKTWDHRVLEEGDGYCMTNNSEQKLNRELSYPSMTLGSDGMVHIAYTFWRQKIKYVQVRPGDIFIRQ